MAASPCTTCPSDCISDLKIKNLRVGADRRVRPRVSIRGWLMDYWIFSMTVVRLRGGMFRLPESTSDFRIIILRVGADRCVRPRVSIRGWLMAYSMIVTTVVRLSGGCLALVPRSPDVTQNPITNWFGWANSYRFLAMWVDHPRWQIFRNRRVVVKLAIVDGARPDSRRMCAGLQKLISGQSG